MEGQPCCSPSFERKAKGPSARPTGKGLHSVEQAIVPTGTFMMGDSFGDGNILDGESHKHPVSLESFSIDSTSVTNAAFAAFVGDTGYVTEAERFGFSAVFHLAFEADRSDILGQPPQTPWWLGVQDSFWSRPGGRYSTIAGREDHPVVHVTWNDAVAYCGWADRRLPTEAEWEYASRGGLESKRYPWGDQNPDHPTWKCNIWQGTFPSVNTVEDGHLTTAPVRSYQPNGYGLWQTVGNVWEWCADWYDVDYYERSPLRNPQGPMNGSTRVIRGGSFLCHDSYCNRYRNSARSSNTPDSSMSNTGFRTVGR